MREIRMLCLTRRELETGPEMATAPALDPTDERGGGNGVWSRSCDTRKRKGEPTGNTNFDLNHRATSRLYQPTHKSLLCNKL